MVEQALTHWLEDLAQSLRNKKMAKLTTRGRKMIKTKNFALSGRRYPIQDISHGRNALARVAQFGTPSEKQTVRQKVYAKYPSLKKSGKTK